MESRHLLQTLPDIGRELTGMGWELFPDFKLRALPEAQPKPKMVSEK